MTILHYVFVTNLGQFLFFCFAGVAIVELFIRSMARIEREQTVNLFYYYFITFYTMYAYTFPVTNRSQIIFYCLTSISKFQYLLELFIKRSKTKPTGISSKSFQSIFFIYTIVLNRSMNRKEINNQNSFPEDIVERVSIIIEHFTFLLYQNVCRSLFERHKLLFAFLLCARILLDKGVIRHNEFNFLLNGGKIEQVSINNIKHCDCNIDR